jgi:hypothetical protein
VVGTIGAMTYDQELAWRMRQLISNDPELNEKKMFGGLAFLIRVNMAIAASGQGGAMVRVDPAQSDTLVATTTATLRHMRGRDMPGSLRISSDDLRTDDQLAPWFGIGTSTRSRCRASPLERCSHLIVLTRRCVVKAERSRSWQKEPKHAEYKIIKRSDGDLSSPGEDCEVGGC